MSLKKKNTSFSRQVLTCILLMNLFWIVTQIKFSGFALEPSLRLQKLYRIFMIRLTGHEVFHLRSSWCPASFWEKLAGVLIWESAGFIGGTLPGSLFQTSKDITFLLWKEQVQVWIIKAFFAVFFSWVKSFCELSRLCRQERQPGSTLSIWATFQFHFFSQRTSGRLICL